MIPRSVRALRLLALAALMPGTGCQRTTATPPAPAATGAIQQAAWLAGHWRGEGLGGTNEELWSPPAAGTMMGVFRHMREGRVVFYEFMTLSTRSDRLVLAIKHFDADMTGWEEPTESVEFPLERVEPDALYFEGMIYRRTAPDEREVTVMLGPDAEDRRPELFTYSRVRP